MVKIVSCLIAWSDLYMLLLAAKPKQKINSIARIVYLHSLENTILEIDVFSVLVFGFISRLLQPLVGVIFVIFTQLAELWFRQLFI